MNGSTHATEVARRISVAHGLPECRWGFPPAEAADPSGLVVTGGDLEPETLIAAYCQGLFPMPLGRRRNLGWWSPDPRAVLLPGSLRVSRSLRRSCRRYEVRVNTAFRETMRQCADHRRPHGWINREFLDAYCRLHELGLAHSVEAWSPDGRLVGGLYGVSIAGLFAGESMFHHEVDASKVALVALVEIIGRALLDVQWMTPHLASLGATDLPRLHYLELLGTALEQPAPQFSRGPAARPT